MLRSKPQSGSVMRLRGRVLATPVLWYRHADTGRTLVLILNNHMGTRQYFETMRQRIIELEDRGYAVFREGVTPAPDADWAAASLNEIAARQVLRTMYHDRPAAIAAGLGWAYQESGLVLRDSWANPDMTDLEIIRMAGAEQILKIGLANEEALAKLGRHADRYAVLMTPLFCRRLARPHARLSAMLAKQAPGLQEILLEQRSKMAVIAVIDARQDAVLIYGAEHADTIEAWLTAAGWARTGQRRWLTVGQLPPYIRSLAGIIDVAFRASADVYRVARAAEADDAAKAAAVS